MDDVSVDGELSLVVVHPDDEVGRDGIAFRFAADLVDAHWGRYAEAGRLDEYEARLSPSMEGGAVAGCELAFDLEPDSPDGGLPARRLWCDLALPSGAWELVFSVTNPDGFEVEARTLFTVLVDAAFDDDGDDFSEQDGDCNDLDEAIHPSAADAWYDGVDANCDEANDYDADGDGYVHVDRPDEAGGTAPETGDCDDGEAAVRPGAIDAWYDGVDANCDGAHDYDADGDGHVHADYPDRAGGSAPSVGDCNDGDADIHPASDDAWYDGVDADCDGANDYDADGDSYVHSAHAEHAGGTAPNVGDCADEDPGVHPFAGDDGLGADRDCDGHSCVTVSDGLTYFVFCDADGDWSTARAACLAAGYNDLVSVRDADEQATLEALLLSAGVFDVESPWIGFADANRDDAWGWSDGSASVYANWAADEPSDRPDEDCACMNVPLGAGTWDAIRCARQDAETGYICEYRTDAEEDVDGDGYSLADGDCDAFDATIHPGARETWYDDVDGDCAGDSDHDADGDGHDAASGGGDDCDDADPEVFPDPAANDGPVANDDVATAFESGGADNGVAGADAGGNVLLNDGDPDSDGPLLVSGVGGGEVGAESTGVYGTLVLEFDGRYAYQLDNDNPLVEALAAGDTVSEIFTYSVMDVGCLTDTATLTVTIEGANDAPVAVDDAVAADADEPGVDPSGNVLANDTDVDAGDALVVGAVGGGVVGGATEGEYGTLRLDADGRFTYVVDFGLPAVRALTESSEPLVDRFEYTVRDAAGQSDTASLSIAIAGADDAPTARDDAATAIEAGGSGNAAPGVDPIGNVLANDDDVDDGDTPSVSEIAGGVVGGVIEGVYGTLMFNADGSFEYILDNDLPTVEALSEGGETITESFVYTVRDASGLIDTASLIIVIEGVNDAPVATDDMAFATEAGGTTNATRGVEPTGNVLMNDRDVDNADTWSVSTIADGMVGGVTEGAYGSLTLNADGSFEYVVHNELPAVEALDAGGDALTESFVYTVQDGGGLTDTATLTITIEGANDAPVAGDDTALATEAGGTANGTPGVNPTGNVVTNDLDDSESRTVSAVAGGAVGGATPGMYGTLTLNADGRYEYVVDNDLPAVEALTAASDSLTDVFEYTVRDTDGLTDTGRLVVTIGGAEDAPVAMNDAAAATEAGGTANGTPGVDPAGDVVANDRDVDELDTRSVSDVAGGAVGGATEGAYGTLTLHADGTFEYVLDNELPAIEALTADGNTLVDSFGYTVEDASGLTDTATLTITIGGANDDPSVTGSSVAETWTNTHSPVAVADIVISDVDAAQPVTARLTLSTSAAGVLSTGTEGAATSTFSDGTWEASGPVPDVNALLAAVTFTPALNAPTIFSIATSVDDGVAAPVVGNKTVTLGYDDPEISIADALVDEDVGDAVLTVSLTQTTYRDLHVDYDTSSDSATAGADYTATSGTLTIVAGDDLGTIAVSINDDGLTEPAEALLVDLSDPVNGTLFDDQAQVTIGANDDPVISIDDLALGETNSTGVLTVSLDQASYRAITIDWSLLGGTASSGSDFEAAEGTLVFAAGQTTAEVSVAGQRSIGFVAPGNALVNTLGGSNGFGSLTRITNNDDDQEAVDISAVFEGGINFGGRVFTGIWDFYVGTNGYVTFGHQNAGFAPDGLAAYEDGPMIAAQFDDLHLGNALPPSPGGNSAGSGDLYYHIDTINDVVTITYDDVAPYGGITEGQNVANAYQIRLHDLGGGDFGIELRYESVNWIRSLDAAGGWTVGDGENYAEVTGSGTSAFLNVDNASNIGQPGVFFWAITADASSVDIQILRDNTTEAAESFFVDLSNPTSATIGDARGEVTIHANFD